MHAWLCVFAFALTACLIPYQTFCYCKTGSESIMGEDFILTALLLGVILEVYCECLLTCHHVWRCVTVLEYILVRCESVCGCINVCRAPPASLQADLANGRITCCRVGLHFAGRQPRRSSRDPERLSISGLAVPLLSPTAACMCATPALCNQTH